MRTRTLENTTTAEITEVFNQSFAKYFVPVNLTEEKLVEKLHSDSIDLKISIGAFDDEKLVGFVLHGCDTIENKKVCYNAGTGVLPEFRGQKLTQQMYAFIIPTLKEQAFDLCSLEVIDKNETAIKSYEAIGYKVTRSLDCFNSTSLINENTDENDIRVIDTPDWQMLRSFWDWQPSWQNSITAISKMNSKVTIKGIYPNNELGGYIAYFKESGRLVQFAVKKTYRNKRLATSLFADASRDCGKPMSIINVDAGDKASTSFLLSKGMKSFIRQFEMEMPLNQ